MSDVRWVCVSDLHFGAENSLLTHLPWGATAVDPSAPSSSLVALVACLRQLVGANSPGAPRPDLVLNGDILELALAEDNTASEAFERFVELALAGPEPVFGGVVLVPGNHDHHLWETAREQQYAEYVRSVPLSERLGAPWHVTRLLSRRVADDRPVQSPLVRALMDRSAAQGVRLEVRYPNFAVLSEDGQRAVVFHHGHYLESIYLLMTRLQRVLFPGSSPGEDVWQWEARNFAWIDFFWSTLGRSGDVGTDVGVVYAMLQSPAAVKSLARNVVAELARHLPGPLAAPARWVLTPLIARQVAKVKRLERQRPGARPLNADAQRGLVTYLSGPLARQLRLEAGGTLPAETTFVFGHTHKPFVGRQAFGALGEVALYNTGGWVVDTLSPDSRQGAGIVLVNADLDVAQVRVYNQTDGSVASPPAVEVAGGGTTAFSQRIAALVQPTAEPWATLTAALSTAIPGRYAALEALIAQGVAAADVDL